MHEGMKTQPMCKLLTPLLGQSIHFITGDQMLVQLIGFIDRSGESLKHVIVNYCVNAG